MSDPRECEGLPIAPGLASSAIMTLNHQCLRYVWYDLRADEGLDDVG